MEEITKSLENIIKEQLKQCEENKTVPSSDVLDTIEVIAKINNCY